MSPFRAALAASVTALLLLPGTAIATGPYDRQIPRLDAYLQESLRELDLPGAAVAVVYKDQVIFERGYGVADRESGLPFTPRTAVSIGSETQSMTATAILQLRDEGRLKLDDPVQRYLPWFRVADEAASARITLRHLLTHTSGLPYLAEGVVWEDPERNTASLEAGVRALATAKLTVEPGVRYQYANVNYNILGLVIQAVTEQPYEVYMRNRVLLPLAMQHTTLDGSAPAGSPMATQYAQVYLGLTPAEPRSAPWCIPAGQGPISTAEDMALYLAAHLGYGPPGWLKDTTLTEAHNGPGMKLETPSGYFAGWNSQMVDGIYMATHDGSIGSSYASMVLMPKESLGVVILGNAKFTQVGLIAQDAGRIMLGKEPRGLADSVDAERPFHVQMLIFTLGAVAALLLLGAVAVAAFRGAVWPRRPLIPSLLLVTGAGLATYMIYLHVGSPWLLALPRAIGRAPWPLDRAIAMVAWYAVAGTALASGAGLLLTRRRAPVSAGDRLANRQAG